MTVSDIRIIQAEARTWLFDIAAPIWSTAGVLDDGMFAERIQLDGTPCKEMNRRLRVQARQIYSFCTIGRLGWMGPWQAICRRALDIFMTRGIRADGQCVHLFDRNGVVINASRDLYDQAFALFALAHAGKSLNRPDALAAATRLYNFMAAHWARPEGGFWEGELTPCPPYRQNPHMHMFEAALANHDASGDPAWLDLAHGLRDLFIRRFRDHGTGAVTEYFDQAWRRLPDGEGDIVEPGHCLEWAWLFDVAFDDPDSIAIAEGLSGFARRFGIDSVRGVAINEVYLDGRVKDAEARLWPQTERLKAAIARHNRLKTAETAQDIVAAFEGLKLYFATPTAGIWYDRMKSDSTFHLEDAPASSFYHIVCALNELLTLQLD